MRQGAESDYILRGERGTSELLYEKVSDLMDMPSSFRNHIDTQIDTLLFNNPSLKKYSEYNSYTETSLDYNLQNRTLPKNNDHFNHYTYDMTRTLPISIYDTLNYRELDNNSNQYTNNMLISINL